MVMTKIDGEWRVPMIRKWKWQSKMRPWMKMGPTAKEVMVIWLMVTSMVFKANARAVTPKREELEVVNDKTIEPSEAGKVKVVLMAIWLMLIRKGQSKKGSTATDEMVIVLMLLLLLVENANARALSPSFDLKSIRYFDEFGEETTAPFEGGKVKMEVKVTGLNAGDVVEAFVVNGQVFKGTVDAQGMVSFEWTFGKETQFGTYKVRVGTTTSPSLFTLHFYIKKCPGDQCKEVCIVTKDGDKCEKPDAQWCEDQKHGDQKLKTCYPEHTSLCRQIAAGKWQEMLSMQTRACGAKTTQIEDENRNQLPFMKAFVVTKASEFTFGCTPASGMAGGTAVWKIFAYDGTKVHEQPAAACDLLGRITLPDIIFDIGGVWLLTLEVTKDFNGEKHRSVNRILLITFPPLNSFECKGNKNDGEYSDMIGCSFNGGLSNAFSTTMTCTCGGKTETASGMEMPVFKEGPCECILNVIFQNMYWPFDPISNVPYKAKADIKMRPTTTGKTKKTETDKTPSDDENTTTATSAVVLTKGVIAGISFSVIVGVLSTILIGFLLVYYCSWKPKAEEKKRQEQNAIAAAAAAAAAAASTAAASASAAEVKQTESQKEASNAFATVPNMKPLLALEEEAKRVGKLQGSKAKKFVDDFDSKFADNEKELIKGKKTRELKHCRYFGGLENVLIKSQVVVEGVKNPFSLHMSKLYDFYGSPMFLCQAPLKDQHFDHLMAITQQKIGSIGMVGKLEETKSYPDPDPKKKGKFITETKTKIDLYFNPEAFGKAYIIQEPTGGQGRQFEIETHGVSTDGRNKTYVLHVTFKAADGTFLDKYDLKVLHVEDWPDNNVPNDPAAMCTGIDKLMKMQQEMAKKGRPGQLVHCSAGIQRSVSVVTTIISVQCWMVLKVTNPLGILGVIREKYRFRALSTEHVGAVKVFVQLQLILKAVAAIIKMKAQEDAGDEKHDMRMIRASFEKTSTLHNVREIGKSNVAQSQRSKTGKLKSSRV